MLLLTASPSSSKTFDRRRLTLSLKKRQTSAKKQVVCVVSKSAVGLFRQRVRSQTGTGNNEGEEEEEVSLVCVITTRRSENYWRCRLHIRIVVSISGHGLPYYRLAQCGSRECFLFPLLPVLGSSFVFSQHGDDTGTTCRLVDQRVAVAASSNSGMNTTTIT